MGILDSKSCIGCGNINMTFNELRIEKNILVAENLILIKGISHEKLYLTI